MRLLSLYKLLMRCMDDMIVPVRESGVALALNVRNLTMRLCDPKYQGRALHELSVVVSSTIYRGW